MAGWVVGKSDFNENPVVSLDLDFDLGFVKTNQSVAGQNCARKKYFTGWTQVGCCTLDSFYSCPLNTNYPSLCIFQIGQFGNFLFCLFCS